MAEYKMCANKEMAIYILEFIKRGYEKNYQDSGVQKYIEALQMGINALSSEVEKVKHAKWEISCDGYYPYCSHCKTEPKNGVMSKRCPECGAYMDGGKTE